MPGQEDHGEEGTLSRLSKQISRSCKPGLVHVTKEELAAVREDKTPKGGQRAMPGMGKRIWKQVLFFISHGPHIFYPG